MKSLNSKCIFYIELDPISSKGNYCNYAAFYVIFFILSFCKLRWNLIAEFRMSAIAIVKHLDIIKCISPSFSSFFKLVVMQVFIYWCAKEAFYWCVFPAIVFAAHQLSFLLNKNSMYGYWPFFGTGESITSHQNLRLSKAVLRDYKWSFWRMISSSFGWECVVKSD